MVNTGDRILVDGREALVNARWASGRHVQFTLSDGRVLLDLHKRDDVQVLGGKQKSEKKVVRTQPLRIEPKASGSGTIEDHRDNLRNGEDLLD